MSLDWCAHCQRDLKSIDYRHKKIIGKRFCNSLCALHYVDSQIYLNISKLTELKKIRDEVHSDAKEIIKGPLG